MSRVSAVVRGLTVASPQRGAPLVARARLPLFAIIAAVPFLTGGVRALDVAAAAALYVVLAAGYAVVLSLCGQFSVAHAAIFGVGAYATAIATSDPHNLDMTAALLVAAGVGALAGVVVGLPSIRLRGDQLAVVTLFIGGVAQLVFQDATSLTGGFGGITDVPVNALLSWHAVTLRDQYLLTALAALAAVALVDLLRRSRLGLAMQAIRDDELVARAAGIRIGATKLAAFAISGVFCGVAGWLYAGRYATVTPARFNPTLSVLIAVMVLLGGPGRIYGAAAGAVALGVLERVLSEYSAVEEGATGAAIMLIVLWRSGALRALLPPVATRRARARQLRAPGAVASILRPFAQPASAALEMHAITRRFGGLVALDEVSVMVRPHQVVAVVGANGSGKSTLLNIVTGVHPPDAGRVLLHGRDLRRWTPARRARHGIVRTFQDSRLLEAMRVIDNVMVGAHRLRRPGGAWLPLRGRGARALAMQALRDVGLDAQWHDPVAILSHGQRRRVELARALVAQPRVLCLDEPTAGLTAEDSAAVARLITATRDQGSAVLLVEHDLDTVGRIADVVVVLDRGRVTASGPTADVLTDPSVRLLLGVTSASTAGEGSA